MTTIDRRVQLLNVRAPDEAGAQRATTLVEDALRTATFAGELPGRVVVIRKLDVGVIPPSAPPASVALVVEAAVQRLASSAVRGDDPSAATAPMVYFEDDADVVISLAQRVASNRPTTEWFWPSVVPGWSASAPAERAITLLLERAAATSAGAVAAAHVVESLAATGALDRLLERLSEADARALLAGIGWRDPERWAGGARRGLIVPSLPPRVHSVVERWTRHWGGDGRDTRAMWLAAMLLIADRPARATNPQLPAVVRAWLESVQAAGQDSTEGASARGDGGAVGDDMIAETRKWLGSNPRSPVDSLFGGGPPAPRSEHAAPFSSPTAPREHDDESAEQPPPPAPPVWKNPRPTDYAGLLFLIPLLSRTALVQAVTVRPELIERDWPVALLVRLARRLGVPLDNPAITWATSRPVLIAAADRALSAACIRAARERAIRDTGRSIRALVHRPGAIVATRTHVDVLMRHSQVDMTVRRAGLDLDPGWVPWLGRVVQFHYLDSLDVSA